MSQNHPIDLLPAFSIGCLTGEEQEAVQQHLIKCDVCRRELATFQDVTSMLAFGAPQECPSELLKGRLMSLITEKPRALSGWHEKILAAWPRLVPAGALAGLILVIALSALNIILWQKMEHFKGSFFEYAKLAQLQATPGAVGATGTLIIGPDKLHALLVVEALKPLPPDSQYQIWLIKNGQRSSGGVFSVSVDGSARIHVSSTRPFADFDAIGVTIEPLGGSPKPTGKKVLGGKITL